jgi:hypothetical protein
MTATIRASTVDGQRRARGRVVRIVQEPQSMALPIRGWFQR